MAKLTDEDKILRTKIIRRLKELRQSVTNNQTEFANDLGLDKQLINSWESLNNERGVSIYSINKICIALNISLKEFFDSSIFVNESDIS